MLLTPPPIQPQSFDDLLTESLVRIPIHNPEYTNYQNNTDPGVTILQLFAFMADNLSYIANQIPDRNRLKFLNLLGIPMLPAAAASGMVTFSNDRGALQTVTLPAGLAVLAGAVGFATSDGLDVLPVEAQVYVRAALSPADQAGAAQTYTQLYAAYAGPTTSLTFYQTESFDPPVSAANLPIANLGDGSIVDRSLWIALLTREVDAGANAAVLNEIAGKTLTLGIVSSSDVSELILTPDTPTAAQPASSLVYEIATGRLNGTAPVYQRLDSIPDADPLTAPALVQLTLPAAGSIGNWSLGPLEQGVGDFPPSLQDQNIENRVVTWIRVRLPRPTDAQAPSNAVAAFNWLGINATRATQKISVPVEFVGTGTGEPDQTFTLMNTPALTDTLQVTINGVPWNPIDDLLAAPSEVTGGAGSQVYSADSATGTLTFGTGVHGARPAAQSKIFVSYSYGGGAGGNVGIGAINSSPQLPAGFKVSNPLPTSGGTAGETLDEAELRIPSYLQSAGRAVSAADFKDIVQSTPGIDLGRVEIIPLYQPDTGISSPGVVTVMVIPNDPSTPQGPVPDRYFLQAVCTYLEPRRLVTTEVHVVGPDYRDLSVSVGFDIVSGKDIATVREAVKAAIRNYLSPLTGGQGGAGWPLNKPVVDRELLAQAARVDGVADISNVLMWDGTGALITTLPVANLQLPRLVRVGANVGGAEDITQTVSATGDGLTLVPVPVLPAGC